MLLIHLVLIPLQRKLLGEKLFCQQCVIQLKFTVTTHCGGPLHHLSTKITTITDSMPGQQQRTCNHKDTKLKVLFSVSLV